MKILGLIPARGGSKGIPGKNIKSLGGKPLLQYSFEAAKMSKLLSRVVLSSDDEKIIEVAKKMNLEVPFVRPKNLGKDTTSSLEVVRHALLYFEERNEIFDAVCLLQPTTPFRTPGLLDRAIVKFKKGGFDSLVTVREVPEEYNPHWVFEDRDGQLKLATKEKEIIKRRQDLPRAYHRDGSLYITRTEVVLKNLSLYGESIGFLNTTGSPYANIDTYADWEEAENFIKVIE